MSRIYWDTSALLKIYVWESDSRDFIELARGHEGIWTSTITTVEISCALHRKERANDIKAEELAWALAKFSRDREEGRITRIPCDDGIAVEAKKITEIARAKRRSTMIRSALDAIHVATAVSAKASAIVTTDTRSMREVAAIVKLRGNS